MFVSARILIIEDNAANMELMRYLLKARGHQVIQALNGEEGLRRAESNQPDLILCDIQLAGIDGIEVLRRLRRTPGSTGIRVLAVTAYALKGDRERFLDAGFDGYFSKPIEPESFAADVERYLDQRGAAASGGAGTDVPPDPTAPPQ